MDTRKLENFWQPGGNLRGFRVHTLNFGSERVATMHEIEGEPQKPRIYAEELVKRWNAYPELLAALEALELRCAQARIASSIGKPRLKDADFLRHECERMAKDARAAITKATGETL